MPASPRILSGIAYGAVTSLVIAGLFWVGYWAYERLVLWVVTLLLFTVR